MHKSSLFTAIVVLIAPAIPTPAHAQVLAPAPGGVSFGHHHLMLSDPAAHRTLWVDVLGAEVGHAGPLELIEIPGVTLILGQGKALTGGSRGSTVNHLGFAVQDYAATKAKLVAAGVEIATDMPDNRGLIANFPDDVRIEFSEDTSLTTPIAHFHVHIETTDPEGLRDWYVRTFGATASSRRGMPSAVVPGGRVDFLKADAARAATRGRSLDHIGFEVNGLQAFVARLEASGVTMESGYREIEAIGLKIAFLVDPAGTRIELTEGLAGK